MQTPRERTREALDRIDPGYGAFITVDPDWSLRQASQAPSGRLQGMTVAVKDLIEVAGLRTTFGSPRFEDHLSTRTAGAVAALVRQGAVVVGKTNLNEFAFGVSGYNPHYGPIMSPLDAQCTAGGSSGGSAVAVALGACDFAIGTDTSGSVRIPAACCGVWGFKCAHGSDLSGIYPLAPSLDSLGYLATGPDHLKRVLDIGGLPDVQQLRVGVMGDNLTMPPLPTEHWVNFREEAWAVHGEAQTKTPTLYGADLRRKLAIPRGDVSAANHIMARWRTRFALAAHPFDVLVDSVFEGGPPALRDVVAEYETNTSAESDRLLARTPTANALGWPALAFPTPDGPRQVLGPPGSEPALFAVARGLSSRD